MMQMEQLAVTVREIMGRFDRPWCLAGGWAIDLFIGRVTRPHGDIELAVFRQDQRRLQEYLSGWTFAQIVHGERQPWLAGEWLDLPVHELHATPAQAQQPLEFLLNERDEANWIFRRDAAIRYDLGLALITSCSLPILAPEIVLLYKAKSPRPRDEQDFCVCCERLSDSQRRWLAEALDRCHPHHWWRRALNQDVR